MKRIVSLLITLVAILLLSVLVLFFLRGRPGVGADETETVVQDQVSPQQQQQTEIIVEEESASAEENAVPTALKPVPAGDNASAEENAVPTALKPVPAGENASAGESAGKNAAAAESGAPTAVKAAELPAAESGAPADAGTSESPAASEDAAASGKPASGANPASGSGRVGLPRENSSPFTRGNADSGAVRGVQDFTNSGPDSYQYFEYQVITVPKKTLAAAAESMGLPADSQPTDELLPAIYRAGGYRVIGYSAGYAASRTPVEFKMSRTEFFPSFYILPQDGSYTDDSFDRSSQDLDGEEDDEADGDDSGDDRDEDDGEYDEDDEDDDYDDYGNYMNSGNNLASIFPFFGDPTLTGNEFFLDIRPPRIFFLDSTMRKMNGFTNTDYGDWGTGQSPVFDDNSFSSMLSATRGKPMIVAKMSSGSAWTLHVFFSQAMPMPEKIVPAADSETKLVRLDFQIVRARWNDICAAGNSDGCPGVPSDGFMEKLMKSSQLRDFYSPSFRMIPSQGPVSIQLNAKTQFVPLKWIPAQDPGIPAIPLNSETVWTGTSLLAAANILNDGELVRLDFRFEKTTQTGWRNYNYSFFGEPEEQPNPMQNRYARPQQSAEPEPEILSGLLKLPMLDTTAFRQALYLEVGKPVLAARISNPAYQPDMLTLLFVMATVEDMQ